jgi:hypothetical protein
MGGRRLEIIKIIKTEPHKSVVKECVCRKCVNITENPNNRVG